MSDELVKMLVIHKDRHIKSISIYISICWFYFIYTPDRLRSSWLHGHEKDESKILHIFA